MKCEGCDKDNKDICNYVVSYESWEAFNCCCEECAKTCAERQGIDEDEVTDITY